MSSVCLSVSLSVTLVNCDHIGWTSSKIISRLVSLRCSLSADQNIRGLLQGKHPEIWAQNDPPPVDLSVGDIRSQIAAERLQIAQRSQWRAYIGNHRLLNLLRFLKLTYHCYDLPFPPPKKWGLHMLPIYANGHISATGDPTLHVWF